MRWRPFSLAALLSAAACAGVLVMWADSAAMSRDVNLGPILNAGGTWHAPAARAQSTEGGLWLQTIRPSESVGPIFSSHVNIMGMRVTSGDVLLPTGYVHSVAVRIPYWLLACAAGMLPLVWLRGVWRRHCWMRDGHCPHCGFDLRVTPDSCPECGLVIVRDALVEVG